MNTLSFSFCEVKAHRIHKNIYVLVFNFPETSQSSRKLPKLPRNFPIFPRERKKQLSSQTFANSDFWHNSRKFKCKIHIFAKLLHLGQLIKHGLNIIRKGNLKFQVFTIFLINMHDRAMVAEEHLQENGCSYSEGDDHDHDLLFYFKSSFK